MSGASNRYPRDLRPIDWPESQPLITAKTSPRGKLPLVREFGPLDGLAAWLDAGGEPRELQEWPDTVPL